MQHDFDASAALLEQVNHALNSATPTAIATGRLRPPR